MLCGGRVVERPNGLGIFLTFWLGDFGGKTTARRADRRRQRPTCRTPWRQGVDLEREPRERPAGREQFPRQVCPKPWLRASPARGHRPNRRIRVGFARAAQGL